MKNVARLLGAMGAVLLVTSLPTWWLTFGFGPLVWVKLIAGTGCLVFYGVVHREGLHRFLGRRSGRMLLSTTLSTGLLLGILVVLNLLAAKHPKQWDFTREAIHTLAPETVELIKDAAASDVEILAFYTVTEPQFPEAEELLKRYRYHAPSLKAQVVDPDSRPELVKELGITEASPRIVVRAGQRLTRADYPTEGELTAALSRILRNEHRVLHVLRGHGERVLADSQGNEGMGLTAELLRKSGYDLKALELSPSTSGELEIPEEVTNLMIAAPSQPLESPELGALEAFLERGGHALILLEPDTPEELLGLLSHWKIAARKDVVADAMGQLVGLGWSGTIAVPVQTSHPAVRGLSGRILLSTGRSLSLLEGGAPGVVTQALVETTGSAWGETSLTPEGQPEYGEDDNQGPLVVGAAAERPLESDSYPSEHEHGTAPGTRLVVFGDADWVSNRLLGQRGNADLLLQTVGWLVGDEEVAVSTAFRTSSQLHLSIRELDRILFVSMDVLPLALVALGLALVMSRRQK